jgi:hypothetical protein
MAGSVKRRTDSALNSDNHKEIRLPSQPPWTSYKIICLSGADMLTSPDFKDLLSTLERHRVPYLVVGGYAVMKYTEPRFAKDLDLWISTYLMKN